MFPFYARLLAAGFVLAVIWMASLAVRADGPAAVAAIAGLLYASAEVISVLLRKFGDD